MSHSGRFLCLTNADTGKAGTQFVFSNLVNITKKEILNDICKKSLFCDGSRLILLHILNL